MMTFLGILLIACLLLILACIIYSGIDCIRYLRDEERLYKNTWTYVNRWYRHTGMIPTPPDICKYLRVPRYVAEEVFRDFMGGDTRD